MCDAAKLYVSLCLNKHLNEILVEANHPSVCQIMSEEIRSFVLKLNLELSHSGFQKADFSNGTRYILSAHNYYSYLLSMEQS